MSPIYLDYNATTPLLSEVVQAMLPFLTTHFGNPSSDHLYGHRAKKAVDTARQQVASLLECEPDEIIFTSGGTEANNLAIQGIAHARKDKKHIITSAVEHPATAKPCAHLSEQGWKVSRLAVDRDGLISPDQVLQYFQQDTALLTIMTANNETGVILPIREMAQLARDRGIVVHTDAAQAVGKIPTKVHELQVDMLSIAGHKLYAPKGVGVLYLRRGTVLPPLFFGAGHEGGLRPGTENVASIVGLGKACEIAKNDGEKEARRCFRLRDTLWERLRDGIAGVRLNGHLEKRLPNTLNLSFPGVLGSQVLAHTPGIAASTGSACHAHGQRPSPVLTAMGLGMQEALGAVRLSLGRATTLEQVRDASVQLIEGFEQAKAGGGQESL